MLTISARLGLIRNGRLDLEVLIFTESGDLVALSNHVALVLGSERNVTRDVKQDAYTKDSKM